LEKKINLSKSCNLIEDNVIGAGTIIKENGYINDSVIGRNVKIGKNVKIISSFIWDDVEIQDDVTIINSLICSKSKIFTNVFISRGCVITNNAVIGKDVNLKEYTFITTIESKDTDSKTNVEDVGVDGVGFRFQNLSSDIYNKKNFLGKKKNS
jgi:translation initiation factor eIF-2B subunit epsilon